MIYFKNAADMGDDIAMFSLGQMYRTVLKDEKQALVWYQKALDKKFLPAKRWIGVLQRRAPK
jgi:TPR repeat protein